jgi:hypothetical protein
MSRPGLTAPAMLSLLLGAGCERQQRGGPDSSVRRTVRAQYLVASDWISGPLGYYDTPQPRPNEHAVINIENAGSKKPWHVHTVLGRPGGPGSTACRIDEKVSGRCSRASANASLPRAWAVTLNASSDAVERVAASLYRQGEQPHTRTAMFHSNTCVVRRRRMAAGRKPC